MAASANLTISIGADSSKLRADLAVAQAALKQFSAELRTAAQAARETGDTTQVTAAAQRYEAAAARVRALSQEIRTAARTHADAAPSVGVFGQRVGELTAAMGRLGGASSGVFQRIGLGAAVSIPAATAAIAAFVRTSATAADEVGDMADALGLSIKAYQELSAAAATAGISQERFARAFTALAGNITQEANKEKNAIIQLAQSVIGPTQQAGVAVLNFGRESSSRLVGGVNEYLKAAREAAPAVQAALAGKGVSQGLDQIAFSLANTASRADAAGIEVRKLFDSLKIPVPARTVFEGLGRDINQVTEVWQRLGIRTLDASGKAKDAEQIFSELADAFKAMPDGIQKTADASALFGAKIGRDFIELLNKGSAGIDELRQRIADLGLGFSKAQTDIGDEFRRSLEITGSAIRGVSGQVGILLAELATPVLDAFRAALVRNSGAIRQWAADIVALAKPAVDDLIFLLQGGSGPIRTTWLLDVRDAVIGFRDAVTGAVPVVIAAFNGLLAALRPVAAAFNALFGTNLTAGGIVAIAIIGRLTGIIPLLTGAVWLAVGAVRALWAAFLLFSTPVRIVLAVVAAIAAVAATSKLFGKDIGDALKRASDVILEFLGLGKQINGNQFTSAASDISRAGSVIAATLKNIGDAAGLTGNKVKDAADEVKGIRLPDVLRGATARAGQAAGDTRRGSALIEPAGAPTAAGGPPRRFGEVPIGGPPAREIPIGGTDQSRRVDRVTIVSNQVEIAGAPAVTRGADIGQIATPRVAAGAAPSDQGGLIDQFLAQIQTNVVEPTLQEIQQIIDAWNGLVETINPIMQGIRQSVIEFFNAMSSRWSQALAETQTAADGIFGAITSLWNRLLSAITRAAAAEAPTSQGFAPGGFVRGPGTGTSDSIPAWLSAGEFVVNAASVRRLGLDVMHRINTFSQGGLVGRLESPAEAAGAPSAPNGPNNALTREGRSAGFLDALRAISGGRGVTPLRLALGGLVSATTAGRSLSANFFREIKTFAQGGLVGLITPPAIHFATGGLVPAAASVPANGRPVHLHIGSQSFALSGSESVVDALVGAAHSQQMRSAGVKPSWFAGRPSGR